MVYHFNKISKKYDIVVVCDQTLFIVNEMGGKLRYQRRLECTPSCIKTYHIPGNNKDIYEHEDRLVSSVALQALQNTHDSPCFSYILGSFSHYLLIYKDVQLVWTSKTQTAPIYVDISKFCGMGGLIVTLSDRGWLQVAYLGTDTPLSQSQALNAVDLSKELNYE
jgi:hypothetical protein